MTTPDDGVRPEAMRAANEDREQVAEALRAALDEGRLSLSEYDYRVRDAYAALTYAELNTLLTDLPSQRHAMVVPTEKPLRIGDPARVPVKPRKLPLALMILWTIWAGLVGLNLATWGLVCASAGELVYPWPIWVAGPAGAALLAVTIGVNMIRDRDN